jgi:hypothetical protein
MPTLAYLQYKKYAYTDEEGTGEAKKPKNMYYVI